MDPDASDAEVAELAADGGRLHPASDRGPDPPGSGRSAAGGGPARSASAAAGPLGPGRAGPARQLAADGHRAGGSAFLGTNARPGPRRYRQRAAHAGRTSAGAGRTVVGLLQQARPRPATQAGPDDPEAGRSRRRGQAAAGRGRAGERRRQSVPASPACSRRWPIGPGRRWPTSTIRSARAAIASCIA